MNLVASESLKWPTLASALEYKQPELDKYLESLPLGGSYPFRLRRLGVAGKKRSFKPGTQAAFALEYCIELNEIGSAYINASDEEMSKLRKRLLQCEDFRSSNPPDIVGAPLINDGQLKSYRDHLWQRKAAFLPPFPSRSSNRASASDEAAFEEWHKVAMLRAEELCLFDWENFPWWPACVTNRAGLNRKRERVRKMKETVCEKLREGMKKLQSTD